MKRKIVLAAVCFAAYSLLLTFSPVFAATNYSGAWEAVGEGDNVFMMSIDVDSTFVDALAIYDVKNTQNNYTLSFSTLSFWGVEQYSSQLAFKWSDDEKAYQIIDYTFSVDGYSTDYYFETLMFGFSLDGNTDVEYSYDTTTGDGYLLRFEHDDTVDFLQVNNANPVPVPTAFVLLSSGLVGLVGFRRKTVR